MLSKDVNAAYSQAMMWMGVLKQGIEQRNVHDIRTALTRVTSELLIIAHCVEQA